MINSFTAYREYHELITILSEKEQKELICAIWYYMFEGIEPKLNKNQMKIFNNLKRPLDKSKSKSKNGSIIKANENQNKEQIDNQNEIKTKSNENQNNNKNKSHQDVDVIVNVNTNNSCLDINTTKHNLKTSNNLEFSNSLLEFVQKELGRLLSSSEMELVLTWEDNELTRHAIKQTALNRATSLKYTQSILSAYKAKGFTTLAEVEADEKRFEENKLKKSNGKKLSNKEIVDNAWKELGLPDD